MKMQIVARVQVEVTKVFEIDADDEFNWDLPTKSVIVEIQKLFEGSDWTAFIDPDFEVEEMPGQPGRPR